MKYKIILLKYLILTTILCMISLRGFTYAQDDHRLIVDIEQIIQLQKYVKDDCVPIDIQTKVFTLLGLFKTTPLVADRLTKAMLGVMSKTNTLLFQVKGKGAVLYAFYDISDEGEFIPIWMREKCVSSSE